MDDNLRSLRRASTVFFGVLLAALLLLPGLAAGSRTPDRSVAANWGNWRNVDPYATAAILSLCPTAASCTGDAGQQTVQLLVESQLPNSRTPGRHRSSFDSVVSTSVPLSQIPTLAATDGVTGIHLDSPVVGSGLSVPPIAFPSLTSLFSKVDNAPAAWSQGYTGKGVGVAIIDTGAVDLPDFGGRVVHVNVNGTSVDTTAPDTDGHGTFVAGVAGGQSPDGKFVGVAPGVTIYAINVESPDGSAYTSDVIAALAWIRANADADNIRVVNMSFSEDVASNYSSDPLDSAVEQLWRSGIVMVASAGNLGPYSTYFAPGNDPFVITVGATDTNDTLDPSDDVQASFSSFGFTLDGWAKPELLAPGRHVAAPLLPTGSWSSQAPFANLVGAGYGLASGTSFAAPQVTGAVALLLQKNPRLSPDRVKWLLTHTSRAVADTPGGALDVAAAFAYNGQVDQANKGIQPAPEYVDIRQDGRIRYNAHPQGSWYAAGAIWNPRGSGNSAASWNNAGSWNRSAAGWNRSAAAWNSSAAWNSASSWTRSAAGWNRSAAGWNRSAAGWNRSAAAWN